MTANEVIGLIQKHVFIDLSAETKVDHQVKKLTGEMMFKLLLFSMPSTNRLSIASSYLLAMRATKKPRTLRSFLFSF